MSYPNNGHAVRKSSLLLMAAVCLFSIVQGCSSQEAVESARSRGLEAGQNDGQRAGEGAGFRTAYKETKAKSYKETLSRLYLYGDYSRPPILELPVVVGFFALGYGLQYGVLYLLRTKGFLTDVDWIVLPPEEIEKTRACQTNTMSS